MKNTTAMASLMMLALLTGCSGILTSEKPAKQYYLLEPAEAAAGTSNEAPWPVLTVSVEAVPGLDTDRLLALGPDSRLHRYANARWPDYLPEVLASVIGRALASTNRFEAVDSYGTTSGDGWSLRLKVLRFYGIQDTPGRTSEVRIGIGGAIECDGERHTLSASESVRVAEERLAAIVAAHQKALDRATMDLIGQIDRECG